MILRFMKHNSRQCEQSYYNIKFIDVIKLIPCATYYIIKFTSLAQTNTNKLNWSSSYTKLADQNIYFIFQSKTNC